LLVEELRAHWRERKASTCVREVMGFREDGDLTLGADTVLLKGERWPGHGVTQRDEARLGALLLAAYGEPADPTAIAHLKAAARHWDAGEEGRAGIHLALSRLGPLEDPLEASRRLFMVDGLMRGGVAPDAILDALGPQPETLTKYSADQPRVPAGSGRPSGEWTTLSAALAAAGVAARTLVRPAAQMAGTALRVAGRASASLDLGSLAPKALGALADFAATIGGSATAASAVSATGVAAVFGVLFIPSRGPEGTWVKVAGPGNISYFHNPDVPGYKFRYTAPDGVPRTVDAAPDPGGNFRGPDGKIFARLVKTATRTGLLVSTVDLVGHDPAEPRLCPAPEPDRNPSKLGRLFEDQMKPLVNPDNPTPSGFSYYLPGPSRDGFVSFDDCQHKTGALFEFKGPNFLSHLEMEDAPWIGMNAGIMRQSSLQVAARGVRPLTWVFAEQEVADYYRPIFDEDYKGQILVLSKAEYLEMTHE